MLLEGAVYRVALEFSDRTLLHQKIEVRFDEMLEKGICDELSNLVLEGSINSRCNAMRGVGYRQVWEYLNGKVNYQEMRKRAIYASRQLAKRQMTWMRQMADLQYYCVDKCSLDDIVLQIEKIVSKE